MLEQITKHDELLLSGTGSGGGAEDDHTKSLLDSEGVGQAEAAVKTEPISAGQTRPSRSRTVEEKPMMSTYRPSARPTSRILQTAAAAVTGHESSWSPSSSSSGGGRPKMVDVVEEKMKLDLKESLIKSAHCMW